MTSMRERMARAAAIAMDLSDHKGYEAVDAILDEMETPSENEIDRAVDYFGADFGDEIVSPYRAMIRAIRDGE